MCVYIHIHAHTHSTVTGRHTQIAHLLTKRPYQVCVFVLKAHLAETRISIKKFTFTGNEITHERTMGNNTAVTN